MVGSCVDEPYLDLVRLFHIVDVSFIVEASFVAPYLSDKQLKVELLLTAPLRALNCIRCTLHLYPYSAIYGPDRISFSTDG
jgi:hypothetical protein